MLTDKSNYTVWCCYIHCQCGSRCARAAQQTIHVSACATVQTSETRPNKVTFDQYRSCFWAPSLQLLHCLLVKMLASVAPVGATYSTATHLTFKCKPLNAALLVVEPRYSFRSKTHDTGSFWQNTLAQKQEVQRSKVYVWRQNVWQMKKTSPQQQDI